MTLQAGEMLQNRYRIAAPLGQGGMGAVYRAWDTRLNVPVALKEMTPQPGLTAHILTQLRQQFQQEAQVLARLSHPHLVRVSDFFEERGNAYLVMDFVEGESLAHHIEREGPLPEAQVLAWAGQLLDALAYCHSQGIIHRDVKPQNVIIRPDGRAVLVDFGLVKLWDPRDPHTKTVMRGMGTPEYAPPEQYDAQAGHTDARSDIYGLGATLYHALAGQVPPTATLRIADPEQFVPLRVIVPEVSERTEAVVTKSLELSRAQRWQSAAEMAQALGLPAPVWGGKEAIEPAAPPSAGRGGTRVIETGQVIAPPITKRRQVPVWVWALSGVAMLGVLGAVGAVIVALTWSGIIGGRVTATPVAAQTATAVVPGGAEATHTPPPSPTATATHAATRTGPTAAPTRTSAPTATFAPTPAPTATSRPRPTARPTTPPTFTPVPPTQPPPTQPPPPPTEPPAPPPPPPTEPPPPPPTEPPPPPPPPPTEPPPPPPPPPPTEPPPPP